MKEEISKGESNITNLVSEISAQMKSSEVDTMVKEKQSTEEVRQELITPVLPARITVDATSSKEDTELKLEPVAQVEKVLESYITEEKEVSKKENVSENEAEIPIKSGNLVNNSPLVASQICEISRREASEALEEPLSFIPSEQNVDLHTEQKTEISELPSRLPNTPQDELLCGKQQDIEGIDLARKLLKDEKPEEQVGHEEHVGKHVEQHEKSITEEVRLYDERDVATGCKIENKDNYENKKETIKTEKDIAGTSVVQVQIVEGTDEQLEPANVEISKKSTDMMLRAMSEKIGPLRIESDKDVDISEIIFDSFNIDATKSELLTGKEQKENIDSIALGLKDVPVDAITKDETKKEMESEMSDEKPRLAFSTSDDSDDNLLESTLTIERPERTTDIQTEEIITIENVGIMAKALKDLVVEEKDSNIMGVEVDKKHSSLKKEETSDIVKVSNKEHSSSSTMDIAKKNEDPPNEFMALKKEETSDIFQVSSIEDSSSFPSDISRKNNVESQETGESIKLDKLLVKEINDAELAEVEGVEKYSAPKEEEMSNILEVSDKEDSSYSSLDIAKKNYPSPHRAVKLVATDKEVVRGSKIEEMEVEQYSTLKKEEVSDILKVSGKEVSTSSPSNDSTEKDITPQKAQELVASDKQLEKEVTDSKKIEVEGVDQYSTLIKEEASKNLTVSDKEDGISSLSDNVKKNEAVSYEVVEMVGKDKKLVKDFKIVEIEAGKQYSTLQKEDTSNILKVTGKEDSRSLLSDVCIGKEVTPQETDMQSVKEVKDSNIVEVVGVKQYSTLEKKETADIPKVSGKEDSSSFPSDISVEKEVAPQETYIQLVKEFKDSKIVEVVGVKQYSILEKEEVSDILKAFSKEDGTSSPSDVPVEKEVAPQETDIQLVKEDKDSKIVEAEGVKQYPTLEKKERPDILKVSSKEDSSSFSSYVSVEKEVAPQEIDIQLVKEDKDSKIVEAEVVKQYSTLEKEERSDILKVSSKEKCSSFPSYVSLEKEVAPQETDIQLVKEVKDSKIIEVEGVKQYPTLEKEEMSDTLKVSGKEDSNSFPSDISVGKKFTPQEAQEPVTTDQQLVKEVKDSETIEVEGVKQYSILIKEETSDILKVSDKEGGTSSLSDIAEKNEAASHEVVELVSADAKLAKESKIVEMEADKQYSTLNKEEILDILKVSGKEVSTSFPLDDSKEKANTPQEAREWVATDNQLVTEVKDSKILEVEADKKHSTLKEEETSDILKVSDIGDSSSSPSDIAKENGGAPHGAVELVVTGEKLVKDSKIIEMELEKQYSTYKEEEISYIFKVSCKEDGTSSPLDIAKKNEDTSYEVVELVGAGGKLVKGSKVVEMEADEQYSTLNKEVTSDILKVSGKEVSTPFPLDGFMEKEVTPQKARKLFATDNQLVEDSKIVELEADKKHSTLNKEETSDILEVSDIEGSSSSPSDIVKKNGAALHEVEDLVGTGEKLVKDSKIVEMEVENQYSTFTEGETSDILKVSDKEESSSYLSDIGKKEETYSNEIAELVDIDEKLIKDPKIVKMEVDNQYTTFKKEETSDILKISGKEFASDVSIEKQDMAQEAQEFAVTDKQLVKEAKESNMVEVQADKEYSTLKKEEKSDILKVSDIEDRSSSPSDIAKKYEIAQHEVVELAGTDGRLVKDSKMGEMKVDKEYSLLKKQETLDIQKVSGKEDSTSFPLDDSVEKEGTPREAQELTVTDKKLVTEDEDSKIVEEKSDNEHFTLKKEETLDVLKMSGGEDSSSLPSFVSIEKEVMPRQAQELVITDNQLLKELKDSKTAEVEVDKEHSTIKKEETSDIPQNFR